MKKIMIIDDEVEITQVLSEILGQTIPSSSVEIFDNSIDALVRITETPFDLIITDHKMPKMLGAEFCYNLRNLASSKNKKTTVIMLSGYIKEAKEMVLDIEKIHLVDKPIGPDELIPLIEKLL